MDEGDLVGDGSGDHLDVGPLPQAQVLDAFRVDDEDAPVAAGTLDGVADHGHRFSGTGAAGLELVGHDTGDVPETGVAVLVDGLGDFLPVWGVWARKGHGSGHHRGQGVAAGDGDGVVFQVEVAAPLAEHHRRGHRGQAQLDVRAGQMGATLVVNGEAVQVPPIGFPGIDGDRRPIDLSGYFFSPFLVSVQIGFVRVRGRGAVLQDEPAGRDRCGCHRELCRRPGSRGRLGEGHWHGLDGSLFGGDGEGQASRMRLLAIPCDFLPHRHLRRRLNG